MVAYIVLRVFFYFLFSREKIFQLALCNNNLKNKLIAKDGSSSYFLMMPLKYAIKLYFWNTVDNYFFKMNLNYFHSS